MKKLFIALSVLTSFNAFAETHSQINYNDVDLISPAEVAAHGNPHDTNYKPIHNTLSAIDNKKIDTVAYDFISADEKNPHNK